MSLKGDMMRVALLGNPIRPMHAYKERRQEEIEILPFIV